MTANPSAPEMPTTWDKASLTALLRDVVADVIQAEMLKPLVNAAVAERMEFTNQKISAIDVAQRESYSRFDSAANRMQQYAVEFQTTARQLTENVGSLKATDNNQAEDIRGIHERLDKLETWKADVNSKVQSMESVQKDLHTDIHGNAADSLRPSIHSMLKEMSTKLDTRFGAIESDIRDIKETQKRHDTFISRQQMIVNLVWTQAKNLWANRLWRWSLISFGIATLGIMGANTPAGIDFITRLIHALADK